MQQTFGKSMAWLHTWAGVLIGGLLFAIFWMGTLSVFDREIDRWMMPGTRIAVPTGHVPLDPVARVAAAEVPPRATLWRVDLLSDSSLPPRATQWRVDLLTDRVPVMRFTYRDPSGNTVTRQMDPNTYRLIPEQETLGATGFIFPFHYGLHLTWKDLGKWLVGLAGMAMLVLLISGVIIHKKLFAQFFTFRPHKQLQRSSLDLHNLTGVAALPFHLMITLSGLVIFMMTYFPHAQWSLYGSGKTANSTYLAEANGRFARPTLNTPGTLASLDAMVAAAEREWGGGRPYFVRVWHPGDANSYVELRRSYAHDITMNLDQIYFDAASGAILHRFEAAPVMTTQRFISGLHFIQFEHWPLRWLYFLAGLSGCVLIATGFLFWLEARRARHAKKGLVGVRVVEGLAVGSITGIMIATLAFLAVNRLLPLGASFAGQERAALEVWVFYLAWLACFAHAWWRPAAAWREQIWAVCLLALACVVLNAMTTGDHLLNAIFGNMRAVAGVDAMLLTLALLAACTARRLARKKNQPPITRTVPATGESLR